MGRVHRLLLSLPVLIYLSIGTSSAQTPNLGPSYLVSLPYPSLKGLAHASVRIARVRLTGRTPIFVPTITGAPSTIACGYKYQAVVIEDLKGGRESFDFFSSVAADFQGFDRDYLVFVKERTVSRETDAIGMISDSLTDRERGDILCRNSEKYYTPTPYQAMRAFDLEAKHQFGGEWLAPVNRIDLMWCSVLEPRVRQGDWDGREKSKGDKSTEVLSWDSARKFISRALDDRRRSSNEC